MILLPSSSLRGILLLFITTQVFVFSLIRGGSFPHPAALILFLFCSDTCSNMLHRPSWCILAIRHVATDVERCN